MTVGFEQAIDARPSWQKGCTKGLLSETFARNDRAGRLSSKGGQDEFHAGRLGRGRDCIGCLRLGSAVTVWGYARVSTVDQDPAPQFAALRQAGVEEANIVVDHASGTREDRPGLVRLLGEMASGDVLTVWKLDRLGRSVSHLVNVVDDLGRRGIEFRSLTEALDTTTPAGRLLFNVVAAVAQFEGR